MAKKSIHVNLNPRRLHEIRLKRREEIRNEAQRALDMGADRWHTWDDDFEEIRELLFGNFHEECGDR